MTAPESLFAAPSMICARCDGPMKVTHDAIGRSRLRCPRCDGIAPVRARHPDDAMIPQGLVRAGALPPLAPGQLRCQSCARGIVGRARLCADCLDASKKQSVRRSLRRMRPQVDGPRAAFHWKPKTCAFAGCETVFEPSGPNARYCEAHR